MRRFFAALGLVSMLAVSQAQAGPITYTIVDYASVQQGYTVAGSITTDGTIGSLSSGNITAWTWTLSNSSGVVGTLNSTDSGAFVSLAGTVTASASQITIGPAPPSTTSVPSSNSLSLTTTAITAVNGASLRWIRRGSSSPFPGFNLPARDAYTGAYIRDQFVAIADDPPGLALPTAATWVIATASVTVVPEPTTLASAAFGLLFAGIAIRKQRSQRASA